jgi:hypothetical protein
MKVIIAGSRDIPEPYEWVTEAIQESQFAITEVISGYARGIDRAGEQAAEEWGFDLVIFPANWTKHKKTAGYRRNQKMAEYADALIAIWDGKSKGTQHMIDIMEKLKKPIELIMVNGN